MPFSTLALAFALAPQSAEPPPEPRISAEQVERAGEVAGLDFAESEIGLMRASVVEQLDAYERMWKVPLDNSVPPALVFHPLACGVALRPWTPPTFALALPELARPADLEQLAFADIPTLAALVKSRRVSAEELARTFLARLRRLDEKLLCVVSFTEERALAQARALDAELAQGRWRGPLHGIPWGAKDLLAAKGAPTTWGSVAYRDQVLDLDAAVVERLDRAGAVLIAKLSLGELAWGDVWFGGTTKNPWKLDQGSSGSSAGSASAVAAGCVPFAIGSETLGSIVSPSDRCGCSSLRPTFGSVSRHGAMALCWTMDKLGPICRSALDAALVFDAIRGADARDPTTADLPASWALPGPAEIRGWRVGYTPAQFEVPEARPAGAAGAEGGASEAAAQRAVDRRRRAELCARVLEDLRGLGAELVPIELPELPVDDLMVILSAEAATAFDELTRTGKDELLVRQVEQAWPNVFRAARLIPAVEYLRANRIRTLLAREMDRVLAGVDLIVHPSFAGDALAIANLTGHPAFVAPCGFRADGTPVSITFTGQLHGEARLLALAQAWQAATEHHRRHPAP